jgi:YidC/Oxa1 family membrane protein insertase
MIGAWPLIMGLTMWFQMKLNPAPPDPVQQKLFTWMPVVFTYLLASFPAGLVIYWAWNNSLSILQQSIIMWRQGVEIPLLENLGIKPPKEAADESEETKTARAEAEQKRSAKTSRRASRAAKQMTAQDTPKEGSTAASDGTSEPETADPEKAATRSRRPRRQQARKKAGATPADREADGDSPT